jgi:hypothetical protein
LSFEFGVIGRFLGVAEISDILAAHMLPPIINNAPQPTNPARKTEDSSLNKIADEMLTGKPTLLGRAPPGFESRFAPVLSGQLPEFSKLPSPRERCPLTGASRSWILDMEQAGRVKIVRIRQPGKMRGACFIYVPSLMALLRAELDGGQKC